jgi:tetratricopeptide (TPR) repeat protein
MLEAYYGLLTSFDGDEKGREVQLSVCLEALDVFPLDAQLLCAMGSYLQAQGRLDLAARAYLTAYRYGKVCPEIWHLDQVREVAAACHSLALQLQKKDEEARLFLQEAVAANECSIRLRRQLLELHVKHGRRDEALGQLDAIASHTPNVEALRSAVRGGCLAHQGNWVSARAYLEAAHRAGCRDPICLRWLTVALASTGDKAKARAILEEWRSLEPNSAEVRAYRSALEGDGKAEDHERRMRIDRAVRSLPIDSSPRPAARTSASNDHAAPPTA